MNSVIFWIHLVLTPFFGISQCSKMMHSTQGVSPAMFATSFLFVLIQTWMSWSTYKKSTNWTTRQVLIIYIAGVVSYGCMLAVIIMKGSCGWGQSDNLATLLATIGTAIAIGVGKKHNLPWHDPIVKGCINIAMRVIPNLFMAYAIFKNGGAGVSGVFVGVFNLLTVLRILQIILTSRKLGGWDRNRIGLIIGESANETSWLIVTVVWVIQ